MPIALRNDWVEVKEPPDTPVRSAPPAGNTGQVIEVEIVATGGGPPMGVPLSPGDSVMVRRRDLFLGTSGGENLLFIEQADIIGLAT